METIFIIGRSPSVKNGEIPITINDPYNNVSSNHCKVTYNGKDFFIEDLNSSNGTFVNGKKLNAITKVNKEQTILLGSNYILNLNSPEFELVNTTTSNNNVELINKVVNVTLTGGIIGIFSSSPMQKLNQRIKIENDNGWNVVQTLPAASANLFLLILRILLLFVTFFFYTTNDGYFIIFEKKTH